MGPVRELLSLWVGGSRKEPRGPKDCGRQDEAWSEARVKSTVASPEVTMKTRRPIRSTTWRRMGTATVRSKHRYRHFTGMHTRLEVFNLAGEIARA